MSLAVREDEVERHWAGMCPVQLAGPEGPCGLALVRNARDRTPSCLPRPLSFALGTPPPLVSLGTVGVGNLTLGRSLKFHIPAQGEGPTVPPLHHPPKKKKKSERSLCGLDGMGSELSPGELTFSMTQLSWHRAGTEVQRHSRAVGDPPPSPAPADVRVSGGLPGEPISSRTCWPWIGHQAVTVSPSHRPLGLLYFT